MVTSLSSRSVTQYFAHCFYLLVKFCSRKRREFLFSESPWTDCCWQRRCDLFSFVDRIFCAFFFTQNPQNALPLGRSCLYILLLASFVFENIWWFSTKFDIRDRCYQRNFVTISKQLSVGFCSTHVWSSSRHVLILLKCFRNCHLIWITTVIEIQA
jgi:hypothetical protein